VDESTRLQSDLVTLCNAALAGTLDTATVSWDSRVALGVVLVSENYPYSYVKNVPICGLLEKMHPENVKIFHAATAVCADQIVTTGGRVLCVTVLENTIHDARQKAYEIISTISFPHMFYRTDIGFRANSTMTQ
jgi:phosphoribosylamine--glycine ligase